MTMLQIEMTDDELNQLHQIAREQGFDTPEAYIKAMILEPTKTELLDDIRQGILASRRGEKMSTLDVMWAKF